MHAANVAACSSVSKLEAHDSAQRASSYARQVLVIRSQARVQPSPAATEFGAFVAGAGEGALSSTAPPQPARTAQRRESRRIAPS
jgi:hypothetical protein